AMEALVAAAEGSGASYWARQAAFERGRIALEEDRAADARDHLSRALAIRADGLSPNDECVERAGILLHLAQSEIALEHPEVAERLLRSAAEDGMASGRVTGRYLAAQASWINASFSHETAERRRL